TEKANNRFPDLHGVKVYVVAPTIQSSERFFQIQKFWLQYFAAAGAILPKEHYSNTLLGFQE
ncbi:MAG: hypothetical protein N3B18_01260, partial [Desulfobacterota bacterium]|nr:hypothetical protein [Thermodesulfobacteriota bacterium]